MSLDLTWVIPFCIVAARVSGLFLLAPGFSNVNVPKTVKVLLLLWLSGLILASLSPQQRLLPADSILPAVIAMEFTIGLGLGFIFRMTMAGAAVAGEMIGLQMGLGIASTIDPSSGTNAIFTQIILSMLYVVVFLALDGHHDIIRTLHGSFDVVPMGTAMFTEPTFTTFIHQTANVLAVGVQLSAGILIPLLLVTFAMALVARSFPQANLFILSYSATLLMGLILLGSSTTNVKNAVLNGIASSSHEARTFLQSMVNK